jgi:hypothetical protein
MEHAAFDPARTGLCLAVLYLIPSKRVRPLIPPHIEIVEVLPGMTLGGIYAARFPQGDNVLNEFGVMSAYVRHESRKGYFLDHFCVDHSGSAGSCMIHDGPACGESDFTWEFSGNGISLDVTSGGESMVSVQMTPRLRRLPISSCFHFLCVKGQNVVFFKNRLATSIGLSTTTVTIPESSPLADLSLKYKLVSTYWEASNVVKREPELMPSRVLKATDEAFGTHMTNGRIVHKR